MSWMCSVDGREVATTFCLCHKQETFLCDAHILDHKNKRQLLHNMLPIAAYEDYKAPGYLEQLQRRSEVWEAGTEELNNSIRLVDECIAQFTMKTNELVWRLTEYSSKVLLELEEIKAQLQREVAEGIAEAEGTMYRHRPQLNSPIAKILREFQPGQLALFSFEIVQEAWPMRMEEILKFEKPVPGSSIEQDIPGHILPQVHENRLRSYDLFTGQTTEASLSVEFAEGTVFCLQDEDTLLCAGGSNPAVATAYLLRLSTAALTALPNMKTAHASAGIIKHSSDIYLFGGWDGGNVTKACEKFNEAWTALPDMRLPRMGFSSCSFGDLIYLPEVIHSEGVMETFRVSTQQFKTHSVALPCWGYRSVAFIVEGELTLIADNGQMAKWRIDAESNVRVVPIDLHEKGASSNIPPMQYDREVFWACSNDATLRKFSLDTQEFTAH